MNDQRKKTRAPLDVYVNKYVGGVPYTARTSDISEDGMRLAKLIEPKSSKRKVGLQFQLPGSEEIIYAEGEIVRDWASPQTHVEGSGIRFTLLSERHRKMIGAYVAQAAGH
ncbi:MAG: PilZ domain-containing protein [Deltaproteobacteria bacterium]|nr:PilZ domain-containing protein [Deltaproteobacteria bacterium]